MDPMKSKKLLLLLVLGLLACGKARESQLPDRIESFNESLRWSSIKAASAYMADNNKRTLIDQYSKDFQKSKIVEYSILDIGMDPSKKTGTVLVEFSAYDNSTQDLSYRQELQTWTYDVKTKNWLVKESRSVSKGEE
jgi:Tfp pilus assembly protein PilX